MPKWVFPKSEGIDLREVSPLGISGLLKHLLAERGLVDPERIKAFLDPDVYQPAPASELPGMQAGVKLLAESSRSGGRIGVWGDFDVDGQTATTLLVTALGQLGADVVYHIPVRATESHGIKLPYLKEFLQQNIDVLLTCDTGISEHESVAYARSTGVKVIITDHHDLPEVLPKAEAVINPKLLKKDHPLATLPGVGAAYKLIEALYAEFGREEQASQFLDLVALGIVADVAELAGDARYLLQRGLERLRQTPRLGLQAIYELADLTPGFLTEGDIGFSIAPRLNALGRLGDANVIVEFLTTDERVQAEVIANQLESMNAQRKLLSSQVFQGAISQLERDPNLLREASIVLGSEHWPPGIIGLVASRLAQQYDKPVVLLNLSKDGLARGSARSVPGCDIGEAIRKCAPLLSGFGGHPMAAGLSLAQENIPRFRKRFSEAVVAQLGEEAKEPTVHIDLVINLEQIDFPLIEEVDRMAPFGPGNPPVTFAVRSLNLINDTLIGRTQEHRRLIVEDEHGIQQSVLWWYGADMDVPRGQFDLAFSARTNFFRGERQLQVVVEDVRVVKEAEISADISETVMIDFRHDHAPDEQLERLLSANPGMPIWGEGPLGKGIQAVDREKLGSADELVVWTVPPSSRILEQVFKQVKPNRVYLFGNNPGMDALEPFLTRLAGLLKFVLVKRDGKTRLTDLAAATAQTETIVRLGIAWLEAKGSLHVVDEVGGEIRIAPGAVEQQTISKESLAEDLGILLEETRLFRAYYLKSPPETLIELIGQ